MIPAKINKQYKHSEVKEILGVDKGRDYIWIDNTDIVACMLTLDLNERAFYTVENPNPEIWVGKKENTIRDAAKLLDSRQTFPLFVRAETNQWYYQGLFRVKSITNNPDDFKKIETRDDVVLIIFLELIDQNERLLRSIKVNNNTKPLLDIENDIENIIQLRKYGEKPTEKMAFIKARIGQGDFRDDLIVDFCGKCPITDVSNTDFLRASHIKPWSRSNDAERINPNNGLLLVANLDVAFDRYLITFDQEGNIIYSKALTEVQREKLFPQILNNRIELNEQRKIFMIDHNEIFNEKERMR